MKLDKIAFARVVSYLSRQYTVFDGEDSSWFRSGLDEAEARELLTERNLNNSRHGERYVLMTDAEFDEYQR